MGNVASLDDVGAELGASGPPHALTPPPRMPRAPASCQQLLFTGHDERNNRCDLASGQWVPAFVVSAVEQNQGTMCTQFCLPLENSAALKTLLKAEVGLCCRQGPGYNDFQGSFNQSVPGVMPMRAWRYNEGDAQF